MSDFWNQPDISGDEDDGEDGTGGAIGFTGRDGIIYMIDADQNLTGDASHFTTCLSIIEENMLNRIILSAKDLVGIIFYNTQHSPAPGTNAGGAGSVDVGQAVPPHTAIMWPVQVISKAAIQTVKNMRASDDQHAFATRYGSHVAPANLAEALWLCSRMLTGCDYKLQSASIVLFTNNDRPLGGGDAAEEQRVFLRANDLRAMNVDLLVVPLIDEFDDAPFYRELIATVNGLDVETFRMVAPAEQRENLCMRSYQRSLRRACLRYFSLELGDGVAIGCGTYALTQAARIPSRVHLMPGNNDLVQTRRCYVTKEMAEDGEWVERVLLPGELTKYMEVGGQRVKFSAEEVASMKGIMAPGMKLLGFKPLAQLPPHSFVKQPSRLLYPSERQVRGSVRLFRALWQRCLERGKFALCVFTQIRKVAPRYVALVPQTEAKEGSDGFRIVYLPMQTDIRELDIFSGTVPSVPQEGFDVMRSVMKKLNFRYEPRMFEDQQIKEYYATVEAMGFDEPKRNTEDTTLPSVHYQDERLGLLVDAVTEAFGVECAVAPKRSAAGAAGQASAAKTARVSALSKDDVCAAILSGAVEKLTVAALRDFLLVNTPEKSVQKLKKAELIELVRKHCEL